MTIRKITSRCTFLVLLFLGQCFGVYAQECVGINSYIPLINRGGNVSICPGDSLLLTTSRFTQNQSLSTFAGNQSSGFLNGTIQEALFNQPTSVAFDRLGNLYVADLRNAMIRKITPEGIVSTLAGTGTPGFQDGPGNQAQFLSPLGICTDSNLNVYVAEYDGQRIRKITSSGVVSTIAGNGTRGFQNGVGTNAIFNRPKCVIVGRDGFLYVADSENHCIRRINSLGQVTTFAGNGVAGYVNAIGTAARFNNTTYLAFDSSGNLLVSDLLNRRIRSITPNGLVTNLAGNGVDAIVNGPSQSASFDAPSGIAIDKIGNVYVSEAFSCLIRKITPQGVVSTFAGSGCGYANGTLISGRFQYPEGIAVNAIGELFISDRSNNSIRKVNPNIRGKLLWNTGDTSDQITVRNSGLYSCKQIFDGCTTNNSIPVNVVFRVLPTPAITSNRTQICEGETASITCNNANTLNCIWSNGATSSTITPNASGIYTVRLVSTGCTSEISNPIEIIVSPLPPQAIITPNRAINTICAGDSIELTANNSDIYRWSNGATSQRITVKEAGNYSVRLVSSLGCEGAVSQPFNLLVNPLPSLAIALDRPSPSICENDSVTLTAAAGLTYVWSTGETTRSIVVKTTQQIGLSVSNGQCTNASSYLVSVALNPRPNPVTLTLNGDLEICDGDSVQLSASVSSGGYIWNTGETSQSITVKQSGVYSVLATNGGCFSAPSDTLNLRVKVIPKPSIDTNLIVRCIGDSVQLIANLAEGQIWSNGDTARTIIVKQAGFYAYQTKSEGCISVPSDPIEVRFSDGNTVQIIADTVFEYGDTIKLSINGAVSGQWIKGMGLSDSNSLNPTVTLLQPGLYTYEALVFDSLGCLKNVNLTIRVKTPFFIPNYITPNSSNQNATWKLMFLQERPNHSVKIFNRYGTPVYYTEKYENDWNATDLSSGIYYYVIKVFGTNERSFKGWLMVDK